MISGPAGATRLPRPAASRRCLEHMFFKGTQHRPTTQPITREIDRLGASANTYADAEEIGSFAEGPATAMFELADIITDMLSRPLFELAEEVERRAQRGPPGGLRPAPRPRRLDRERLRDGSVRRDEPLSSSGSRR